MEEWTHSGVGTVVKVGSYHLSHLSCLVNCRCFLKTVSLSMCVPVNVNKESLVPIVSVHLIQRLN